MTLNSKKDTPKKDNTLPLLKRRSSLSYVVTGAFIGIFILIIVFMSRSYNQLINFQSTLTHITKSALPEIASSRNIHYQINQLFNLSNHVANAENQVKLRIAYTEIQSKLNDLNKQISGQENLLHLSTQLNLVNNEVSSLHNIIERKLSANKRAIERLENTLRLNSEVIKLSNQTSKSKYKNTEWVLLFSESISLANKVILSNRLQDIRQIYNQINTSYLKLDKNIINLPQNNQIKAKNLTQQLYKLLLDNGGLLKVKIDHLRMSGRVIGRANFIKNLIDVLSRMAEQKSYQTNAMILDETNITVNQISEQIKVTAIISLVIFILLLLVSYFIKKHFVERIINLNNQILSRFDGKQVELDVRGNDEISNIARSFNYYADKVEEQTNILHELSLTDELTGLYNRRAIDLRLTQEMHSAHRHKSALAIMIMDIDFFKIYNDTYGHIAGDKCLKLISNTLSECKIRSTDFVARYGGEEFVMFLPSTDNDGAERVAKNILSKLNALNIKNEGSSIASHITMSIGIANFDHKDIIDNNLILNKADKALYAAKNSGRNCIFQYHDID